MSDAAAPTRLLDGRLLLSQPPTGHRVGTDAVLLAAATRPAAGESVIDVGCGVGSVGLAVAVRQPDVRVRLMERVPDLAAYARANAQLNGVGDSVQVHEMDLFDAGRRRAVTPAGWVVSNPPFQAAGTSRLSPDRLRAAAHALDGQGEVVGHGDWLRAMVGLAAPHGAVLLIHRADALPDLLAAAAGRLGGVRVLPIHAHADQPAIRVLFGGIVGSRAPFGLLPPLALHAPGGGFNDRAAAIHRGEALLDVIQTRKSRPRGPAS